MKTLICRICKVPISKPIIELEDKSKINLNDKDDLIPQGFYIVWDNTYERFFSANVGQIFINLNDVLNTKYHHDEERLNGCCGCDGLDGINVVCKNGHEIGTEESDCWMPHSLVVEKDYIDWNRGYVNL